MAKWSPNPASIDQAEVIGRRIFSDAIWDGPLDQGKPRTFRLDHFMETRSEEDVSVDRLGLNAADGLAKRMLTTLADKNAASRGKPFNGWAACRCKDMTLMGASLAEKIYPDPLPNAKYPEEAPNPYHAQISRGEDRHKTNLLGLAMLMREMFSKKGHWVEPSRAA